jgi:hypothetical protein
VQSLAHLFDFTSNDNHWQLTQLVIPSGQKNLWNRLSKVARLSPRSPCPELAEGLHFSQPLSAAADRLLFETLTRSYCGPPADAVARLWPTLSVSPAAPRLRPVPVRNDPTSFGSGTLAKTHLKPKTPLVLYPPTREIALFYRFEGIVTVPKRSSFGLKNRVARPVPKPLGGSLPAIAIHARYARKTIARRATSSRPAN